MKCFAIQVDSPSSFSYKKTEIGEPKKDEAIIDVYYSAICRTDFSVLDGSLIYYRTGYAKYPIITGHEWVGLCDGKPVVGLCIMGCDNCHHCRMGNPVYCDSRIETGVVNKDGGHARNIIMPRKALLSVPEVSPKFALVEPMAVAVRGYRRLQPSQKDRILINGHGSLGRMFSHVLRANNIDFDIYDIKQDFDCDWSKYNVFIECSGASSALKPMLNKKGCRILAYGFEYDLVDISQCVANEINFVTSLGSDKRDFEIAIKIIEKINIKDFKIYSLEDFNSALDSARKGFKVILDHNIRRF